MTDKELMQRAWDSLAAWKEVYPENWDEEDERLMDALITRLAPLQREWQGLTKGETDAAYKEMGLNYSYVDFARAIETKLKEKNSA